ncbi:MAG: 30S ribosome-binding factor RbfA [Elusimicrobiota bacterium]|nr:30S ribosome-binding factor RbfA [Elusimicrobiota bacterium]
MRIERKVKLAKQIKREVNGVIHRDFHIPLGVILTVTDVTVSNDCHNCYVFYSVYIAPKADADAADESRLARETSRISRMLTGKANHFKYVIGKNMRIKIIPDVHFKLDMTPVKAAKIDDIFDEISKENKGGGS